jgi:hypothetical protein
MGGVNVKLVTFSSSGTSTNWMDAEDALTYIDNISNGGWTNYEAAVAKTYTDFDAPQADQTIAYFISDGEPTRENKEGRDQRGNEGQDCEDGWLDQQYVDGWEAFAASIDNTHIVALGDGIDDISYLDMLANAAGVETQVVVDSQELTTIIRETSQTVTEEFTDTREIQVLDTPAYTETVIDYDTITSLNLVESNGQYYRELETPANPIMQDLVQTRELDVPLDSLLDLEGNQEYLVMDSEGHTIDLDEHTFTSQGSTSLDDTTFTHYTSNNIDIYVEDSIDDII